MFLARHHTSEANKTHQTAKANLARTIQVLEDNNKDGSLNDNIIQSKAQLDNMGTCVDGVVELPNFLHEDL